jgi:hypothetical protein
MEEIWKDIKEYEGLYQVSNLGRVKSIERKVDIYSRKNKKYYKRTIKQKFIKYGGNTIGYVNVALSKDGYTKPMYVHRLVAEAFIPNPNNYPVINHKDENKENNTVDNLEWCTIKYNNNYGTRIKTAKQVNQYDLAGNFIKKWESINEASKELKLKKIWEVCNGKRNKCGNFVWKYAEEE